MNEYVSGSKASAILGVHQRTLYLWDEKKLIDVIRTPGGKRLYNVKKYLAELESKKDQSDDETNKRKYNLKKKSFDSSVLDKLSKLDGDILSPDTNKDDSEKSEIKIKPLPVIPNDKMSEIYNDKYDPSPVSYKRRIDPNKKENIIFAQNMTPKLIEKYPEHTVLSGDKSLTKFLDLIIANKANNIVIDKSDWNIDSYNMLIYLANKFSDCTIIGENNVIQNNDSTDMQTFIKMMNSLINKQ